MRSRQGSLRRARRARRVAALAAGAVAVLAADGSSSSDGSSGGADKASAPGITATEVMVGGHLPLTGPAAPGYSEIPPATKAYFEYVNANGGVNGRKIKLQVSRDDGYNPTNTVKVVQAARPAGQGVRDPRRPRHADAHEGASTSSTARACRTCSSSSGCRCWDQPDKYPYTFGWQPDYTVEGKILGHYVKKNLAGKKVAYFYQDDDFGKDGVAGLDKYIKADVVARQSYAAGQHRHRPADGGDQAVRRRGGRDVHRSRPTPRSRTSPALKLGMKPQFVVSNVGTDPTTVGGLLKAFSKGKAGSVADGGLISDGYLPPLDDQSDSWAALFRKVHDTYIPKLPLDGNVNYGMALAYTFANALQQAGQNPTRQGIVDAIEKGGLKGPTLVPYRFSADSHAGATGVQMAKIADGKIELMGDPVTTDDEGRRDRALQRRRLRGAGQRRPAEGVMP